MLVTKSHVLIQWLPCNVKQLYFLLMNTLRIHHRLFSEAEAIMVELGLPGHCLEIQQHPGFLLIVSLMSAYFLSPKFTIRPLY